MPMSMQLNRQLPMPADLKAQHPLSPAVLERKAQRDREIREVFEGKSDKFIVIIGPCSADNQEALLEYVHRLAEINEAVKDRLLLIPRVYTNKPRTTGDGYKGMLQLANGDCWKDTGYLFTQDDGRPMNPTSITAWLRKFSMRRACPISIHTLSGTVWQVF